MSLWLSKQPGLHERHQQDANQRCGWQASCKYLRVLCPPLACIRNLKTLIYRLGFCICFHSADQPEPGWHLWVEDKFLFSVLCPLCW